MGLHAGCYIATSPWCEMQPKKKLLQDKYDRAGVSSLSGEYGPDVEGYRLKGSTEQCFSIVQGQSGNAADEGSSIAIHSQNPFEPVRALSI